MRPVGLEPTDYGHFALIFRGFLSFRVRARVQNVSAGVFVSVCPFTRPRRFRASGGFLCALRATPVYHPALNSATKKARAGF